MHSDELKQRWNAMTMVDQLGNIGSEVGRSIKRKQEGNQERFTQAFDRALELFDLTISDPRWRSSTSRLRELTRAREVICDFLFGSNDFGSDAGSLERYFTYFAISARTSA